jgi:putative ABC transport system permease protein
MSTLTLILREIRFRRVNAGLTLLGLTLTVSMFTAFAMISEASERETRRIMRDLGFNLRILPKDTDMDAYWLNGYADTTMPESAIERLTSYQNVFFSYNHLVASLQMPFIVGGKPSLLTGLAPTVAAPGKKPMGFNIKSGEIHLGSLVASRLGARKGDTVLLGDVEFRVANVMVEKGSNDDVRVYGTLADMQRLLGLPGRINEIKAIDCLCLTSDQDPLKILRAELEKALPEARVIQMQDMADTRARQRQMVEKIVRIATPTLLFSCAAWVAALSAINVRDRRSEIGALRALGQSTSRIAALFLGKAALLGLTAAGVGFAIGAAFAMQQGAEIASLTAKALRIDHSLLGWSILLTPFFAMTAALVPTATAAAQDPADILREE